MYVESGMEASDRKLMEPSEIVIGVNNRHNFPGNFKRED